MRWRPVAATGLCAVAAASPAAGQGTGGHGDPGAGEVVPVSIGFDDYTPARVAVLPGDRLRFTNDSVRVHTVTADDGGFDSGRIVPGEHYERTAGPPAVVPYHCTLHPTIRGTIEVRSVLLDPPAAPAAPRRTYPLRGRAALPPGTPVTIEADSGAGFAPAATATVGDHGRFTALLTPVTSASYRAVAGTSVSEPVRLLVLDRRIDVTARRRRGRDVVTAAVTPPTPGATVVLQLRIPERFGWWPVQRTRLDHRSRARFVVRTRRRLRARVHLTLRDGATTLAQSRTLRVGPQRR